MALALLVNEPVANALKRAHAAGDEGLVELALAEAAPSGELVLSVRDHGRGLAARQAMPVRSGSLDARPVEALAGRLRGVLGFEAADPGLGVRLVFDGGIEAASEPG